MANPLDKAARGLIKNLVMDDILVQSLCQNIKKLSEQAVVDNNNNNNAGSGILLYCAYLSTK